ncbi:MAG: Crp/Fnr family transcriptional regulator [Endomicrobiaceae bacterium]
MKEYTDVLKKMPLFCNIDEKDIVSILSCLSAKEKIYNKEEYIWSEENKVSEAGIILAGSVNVIKEDYWGNRAIISKFSSGKMFGEAFSCSNLAKLPVSVVASEKTKILFINYKKIITICPNSCAFHSKLIDNMLKILADNNIMLIQKMEHIVKRTTREKILSFLSEQAKKANNNSFKINFNRQELADYLYVDRSAMSNEISKLRNEGILSFKKNHFKLFEKKNPKTIH